MGICCSKKSYHLHNRQLVKICPKNEGANLVVRNLATYEEYYLWYDETEKDTITLGMILDCVSDYEKLCCTYILHNLIPKKIGASRRMTLKDYVEKSIKTPGYQCFNQGYIYIPMR